MAWMRKDRLVKMRFEVLIVALLLGSASIVAAGPEKSEGQTLYVPVYSNIYSGNIRKPAALAINVSVRNTDPINAIDLVTVDYYDSKGHLIRHYLDKPFSLAPLASARYIVKDSDKTRGPGAKFIVRWKGDVRVNAPLAEGIMISTASQMGISFTCRGVVIED